MSGHQHPLLRADSVLGHCDVVLYHARHDLTMAHLTVSQIQEIIREWTRIYVERGKDENVRYVQIFENKGSMMGCSNPHPHGQVWSLSTVPTIPALEMASLRRYSESATAQTNSTTPCLLCDYVTHELSPATMKERIVFENEHWAALVPWWASWPFEVMVLPWARHVPSIIELTEEEQVSLARVLSVLTIKYDNLFKTSFPYSFGIHGRPCPKRSLQDNEGDICHLHMHFYPPLLRNASVRKFLVGFEMMSEPQRDLTAEDAALRLRQAPETHYSTMEDRAGASE